MKKTIASIFIASVLAASLGTAAFAVEELPIGFEGGLPTIATSGQGAVTIISLLTNWLFVILSIAAVIFIVLAAFQFITSGGSPEAIGQARTKLLYAAIGIVVALIARAIPFVLASILGAGGVGGGGVGGGGGSDLIFTVSVPNDVDPGVFAFVRIRDVNTSLSDDIKYELDCDAADGGGVDFSDASITESPGNVNFDTVCLYSTLDSGDDKTITVRAFQPAGDAAEVFRRDKVVTVN